MSVSQRLTHRLQQALGAAAAEDLVDQLSGIEVQRAEWTAFRSEMRAEFAEMRAEFAAFRAEMRTEFGQFRADMLAQQLEMQRQVASFGIGLERMKADLLKWSFLFWVGAVTSVAVLAGVLRN
jgi:hypothetical protein